MKNVIQPAIWLMVIIVGLPQLSETAYTPSLPDIAKFMQVEESWVEYTLTIYLFGFAIGTLFFGNLSDAFGRKPCLLAGFLVYVIGCILCFFSESIQILLISRFIQGFGGSVGSVLGQAICRDAFSGKERGKVYSTIGSTLAFAPAIGPIIGGFIDQSLGWSYIFLLLIILGIIVLFCSYHKLVETHDTHKRSRIKIRTIAERMYKDHRVLAFGMLVACCNGIGFSYYAEGSFYLIDLLDLTPSIYGMSFLGIAFFWGFGGYLSKKMHDNHLSINILRIGVMITLIVTIVFAAATLIGYFLNFTPTYFLTLTLFSMWAMVLGMGMIIPNSLSLALENYQDAVGTATSLFGFFYYTIISGFTLGMGALHNDTLLPMPLYFCTISILMWIISRMIK